MVFLFAINGIILGLGKKPKTERLFLVLSVAVVSENGLFALCLQCGFKACDGLA